MSVFAVVSLLNYIKTACLPIRFFKSRIFYTQLSESDIVLHGFAEFTAVNCVEACKISALQVRLDLC